jgi:wyosine [tRNA(Phe)-imidazoG37] synthetase (radical SAM superfamily)
MNYLSEAAKKIGDGIPVAFYAVSTNTIMMLTELKVKYGRLPAVVCDKDSRKHGKKYKALYDLDILSFDAALEKYPGLEVLVATSNYRHQIIGELLESGKITGDRIINYTPVVKRKSCRFVENRMLYYYTGHIQSCTSLSGPRLYNYTSDRAGEFIKLMRDTARYIAANSKEHSCHGCKTMKVDWYPVDHILNYVNYCPWHTCNFKCSYCFGIGQGAPDAKVKGEIEFGELIKPYLDNGWLDPDYDVVHSTVGEPTTHPKRKKFYNAFTGNTMNINTNGSVFDEDLFDLMNDRKGLVQISLDAGTRETFAKIKGADCFERVVGNIRKYAEAKIGMVMLKYIFLPGVNDNDADINGFIDVIEKTGVFCVNLALALGSYRISHRSEIHYTPRSLEQMRRVKAAVEGANKLCFLNMSNETEDCIDKLQKEVLSAI